MDFGDAFCRLDLHIGGRQVAAFGSIISIIEPLRLYRLGLPGSSAAAREKS